MKVTELRIGNWIREKGRQYEFTVSSGTFSYMEIHKDFFEPIPLTEEWIRKFGFKYNGFGYHSEDGELYYSLKSNKIQIIRGTHILEKIRYVHQLQNFYFALNEEELVLAVTPINTKTNGV